MSAPPPDRSAERRPALGALDRHLDLLLLAGAVLLVAGWLLPVMTIRTLVLFDDKVSILGAALGLLDDGDYLLFAIVAVFTGLFPLVKLALAYVVWLRLRDGTERPPPRALGWVERLGRWSMLDVFVVALLVVVVKASYVSDVEIHAGIYVFAGAVALSMLAVRRVVVLAQRRARAGYKYVPIDARAP